MRVSGILLAAVLLGMPAACSDSSPSEPSANLPANHTVVRGGARHAPGANAATQNCTACHGSDLRGGANGEPSCYRCHGKKWS